MLKRIKDSIFDILRQADWLLLCLCCGAALFGLVMIASATNFLNSWKMVIVQACAIVLGVGIYFLMSQIDLTEAAKRWKWLLGFGIVMFLLLKTPLGIENNGNRAWLGIQGFPANIQPAEIVKLTFILVLSRQLVWVKENWGLKSLRSIAFLAGHVLLMVGLYYVISSDMGSALVYIFIFAAMAFVAGVAARWFIIALLGGGAAFYLLWELDKIPDYMKERFMVVFDHNLDPLGAGWQQTRSLLAIGGVGDIGSLAAYLLYVKQVSQPIAQMSQQVNTILAAVAGAERVFAVMEEQPETDEGKTVLVRAEKKDGTLREVPYRTGCWAWKAPDGTMGVFLSVDTHDLRLHQGKGRAARCEPVCQAWAEDRLCGLHRRRKNHRYEPHQSLL